jgi:hypothetical protein
MHRFLGLAFLLACQGGPRTLEVPCEVPQIAPYPDGLPYVGIHANAANDDVVACATHDAFVEVWHALQGHAVMQPATLSPDASMVYVTATNPEPEGCTLFALDAADGSEQWCESLPFDIVASSVEVDEDGNLFVSAGGRALSYGRDGALRWDRPLWPGETEPEDVSAYTGYGVHFTADGYIATVTQEGLVFLLDRATGDRVANLDLKSAFGVVSPPDSLLSGFDLVPLMPDDVVDDVESIFGDRAGAALGSFFGGGTNFSDNTIAISPRGELYIIGGGPTEETGSLMQVRVEPGPTLAAGWLAVTRPGSAATPSVTPDGRWVAASDGTATRDLMDPESADATVFALDVDACDANTDADPDICAVAWEHPLQRGPMPGAPALLPDGSVWFYELGFSLDSDPEARDLVRVGAEGVLVERTLPDGLEWNSVLTVSETHIIGTASVIRPSDETLAGLTLPSTTEDELLVLDRNDASVVFRAPLTDDSAATVSIGPNGELYAGLLGLTTMLAVDQRPTLGLVRFSPTRR